VKYLHVRVPPELRRRSAVAAACRGLPLVRYSRHLLEQWLLHDPETRPELPAAPAEAGAFTNFRYPVSDRAARVARVLAAEQDVSVSVLMIRILYHYTPRIVESLALAMTAPPETRT